MSDLDLDTFAVMRDRLERSSAERDAAYDCIADLLDILVREGGFMPHENQMRVRKARALLADGQWKPKREA